MQLWALDGNSFQPPQSMPLADAANPIGRRDMRTRPGGAAPIAILRNRLLL
jgi:hypothetical protein